MFGTKENNSLRFFLKPARGHLTLHAGQLAHHAFHTALAKFFHHTLHLRKLFEHPVDILDLGAGTTRNPFLA